MGNGRQALSVEWGLCENVIVHTILGGSPVILLPTLLGFPSTAFLRPRPLLHSFASPLPPPTTLPLDLAERTRLHVLDAVRIHVPKLREHPFLHVHDFTSLLSSVPLISSPPSLGSNMELPSSSETSPAPSSGSFRQEGQGTPKLLLHPYGFRDKSLRQRNSSPLSKHFGKNLNMNTPKRLDHCKEQLNAKLHAQSCCHATNENEVKVPETTSTNYGHFSNLRMRKGLQIIWQTLPEAGFIFLWCRVNETIHFKKLWPKLLLH